MIHPHRRGLAAILCLALAAALPSLDALAGPQDDGKPVFHFRDGDGAARAVVADHLWFQIYTGPSRTSKYSVRAVYDPVSHTYLNFKEMSSFTVKRGPDGYVATFTVPGESGTRTLPFDKSENFLGEEYVPSMIIKLSGRSKRKHEYILLDDVVWPIEVKRKMADEGPEDS
jgi:hypothetical protein